MLYSAFRSPRGKQKDFLSFDWLLFHPLEGVLLFSWLVSSFVPLLTSVVSMPWLKMWCL